MNAWPDLIPIEALGIEAEGIELGKGEDFFVSRFSYSSFFSAAKWLASSHYILGTVELWELQDGQYHKHKSFDGTPAHGNYLHFSPDIRMLVFRETASVFTLLDIKNSMIVGTLTGHRGWSCATAFNRDGRLVATGAGGKIRIWNVESQELLAIIEDQDKGLISLTFAPDAAVLIAASGKEESDDGT